MGTRRQVTARIDQLPSPARPISPAAPALCTASPGGVAARPARGLLSSQEGSAARVVPASPLVQKTQKIRQRNQHVARAENTKNAQNEKPTSLRWEHINSVTWKLVDPDSPRVETPRSHGQWPGFFMPKALAWCFDAGHGWRVRVLKRGKWQHHGHIIDFAAAKRIAMDALEQPLPKPAAPFGVAQALAQAQRVGLSRGQA